LSVFSQPPASPREPARQIANDAEAIAVAHALAPVFAKESALRDRERRLPHTELDLFSQSGLWGMNIPVADGGAAVSYATGNYALNGVLPPRHLWL
jgi:alkylation response protein AidB-like acyl-CoA dehydrogenase